ncbi:hypothetical protein [Calothrix sp. NIES-3974]|uniref:hypothetical protein n=1 Tax=Calothrix sp. NIES-3974 TaxID=2005462 RepID=UPI0012FDB849|nr:hypothetical protein [Calothrix sp. NIES-3974]
MAKSVRRTYATLREGFTNVPSSSDTLRVYAANAAENIYLILHQHSKIQAIAELRSPEGKYNF